LSKPPGLASFIARIIRSPSSALFYRQASACHFRREWYTAGRDGKVKIVSSSGTLVMTLFEAQRGQT
jgi:hypothetical protein